MPQMELSKKQARTLTRIIESYLTAEGDTTDPLVREVADKLGESKEKETSQSRSKAKKSKKTEL